jgi:hypothetical protein
VTDIDEEDLRALLRALREEDGRAEPEFRAMWDRAGRSALTERSRFGSSTRWVAVAAAILIAAALLLGRAREFRTEQQSSLSTQTITTWQSPTAALLQPPARDLLSPPPLLSSVFDGVASPALQVKTD